MLVPPTTSTGLPELDAALGRLYLGDNVLWEVDQAEDARPFYAAVAAEPGYSARVAVGFSPGFAIEGFTLIDARGTDPDVLLRDLLAASRASGPGDLLLFDDLTAAADLWGREEARRFFARTCPALLRLGAVAYWTLARRGTALRDHIHRITQCVLTLDGERLVIAKADGRPHGIAGSVLRYRVEDGAVVLTPAPQAARLGAGLTALRAQRGLSQTDLARIAGVSPSAVSQAERGHRGLSLATLVELSDRLGVSLDDLVRGHADPGYHLYRRLAPHTSGASREPLVDSAAAPFRIHEFRLDAGARGGPPRGAKGTEVVLVGQGVVQVEIASGAAPVLREGEAVVAARHGVRGWQNVGDDDALGFWLVI